MEEVIKRIPADYYRMLVYNMVKASAYLYHINQIISGKLIPNHRINKLPNRPKIK